MDVNAANVNPVPVAQPNGVDNTNGDRPPAAAQHIPVQQNHFGAVRDRLFHAMLVKVAIGYSNAIPLFWRRVIECLALLSAVGMLFILLFVHFVSARGTNTCLDEFIPNFPRDGVIRLEVVKNLDTLNSKENWIVWYKSEKSRRQCRFNPADVLRLGPAAIPAEVRQRSSLKGNTVRRIVLKPQATASIDSTVGIEGSTVGDQRDAYAIDSKPASETTSPETVADNSETDEEESLLSYFLRLPVDLFKREIQADMEEEEQQLEYEEVVVEPDLRTMDEILDEDAERAYADLYRDHGSSWEMPKIVFRIEYSQFFGLLRLPLSYRRRARIPTTTVKLDANSECFGDPLTLWAIHRVLGYDEAVISSFRKLAANQSTQTADDSSDMGFLHNLDTGEQYHFVANGVAKSGYFTAAVVMLIFTFAISLLLRFSHHQIFVFIVDLLHMFELNQPLQFPAAPLLTVILALVGMEAIMSEVFNDTTVAFYVILVVWIADQFDAICCHTPTSKRYWLRFFYLYQFFFYAYQYRYGPQFGVLALVTSAAFILHSMIYFFHHYEMPLILYQERLQRILSEIQSTPPMMPAATQPAPANPSGAPAGNPRNEGEPTEPRPMAPTPSSVFDARTPPSTPPTLPSPQAAEPPAPPRELNPQERVAEELVADAIEELFQS